MVDGIDEIILSTLSTNSRQDTSELSDFLSGYGYNLTDEEIESRISKLEEDHVITGYTISIDMEKLSRRPARVLFLTFRTSQHLSSRLTSLKKYFTDAPFALFSGRTRGGYDWISVQSFITQEMADEESDIFRSLFGDIIQSYEVYDFNPTKGSSIHALIHTSQEYKKFLNEWSSPSSGSAK